MALWSLLTSYLKYILHDMIQPLFFIYLSLSRVFGQVSEEEMRTNPLFGSILKTHSVSHL